jgi:lysophospholipase L1-like esterase
MVIAACVLLIGWYRPLPATLVTFQVDIGNQPFPSPDGIHILGSFNAFSPAADSMAAVGPNRYAITLNLAAGSQTLYKFVNGDAWTGTEGVLGSCAFNTYRLLQVPAMDTVLPWACFGYCDSACTPAAGLRMACVGNSITFGYGLPDPAVESYPSRLQAALGPGFLVGNFGASGTAVNRMAGNPYTLSDAFRHLLPFQPQEVVLMLGINDSKPPIWGPYGGRFAADYDSLWMAMDTLASRPRIWICLPTTVFSGLAGVDATVLADSILPHIRAHARRHCLDQIDMQGFTSGMAGGFPDGVHPDAATTQLIADEFHRILTLPRPVIQQTMAQLTASGGYAWQWYRNGDTVATALGGQLQTLTVSLPGTYRVAVKVDSTLEHILVSDIFDILPTASQSALSNSIAVYPCPALEEIKWQSHPANPLHFEVRVIHLSGRLCMHLPEAPACGSLDISHLSPGCYVMEFRNGDSRHVRIIWKQ